MTVTMGVRTTIALAVVALALLGYILFVDRGTLTSGELDKRKADALPEFVRDRVTRIEIQRKGTMITLERGPDRENDLELGRWKLTAPLAAEADQDGVEDLVGALEWMSVRRRLEQVSAEDRQRFGFDAPRYRVWFTIGRGRFPVVFGKPAPGGEGVYMQGSDRSLAFVVGKEAVDALNHEPGDFHTKELHGGLSSLTTKSLKVRDSSGERALDKRDGVWWLGAGATRALASEPDVDAAVEAIDRLRAKRFVAAEVREAKGYGLDAPFAELSVTYSRLEESPALETDVSARPPDPNAKRKTQDVVLRLVVGAACAGHAGERYLRVGAGPVMCVAEADLGDAQKTTEALRERRLVPFDAMSVKVVRLERAGRVLSLVRKDEKWSYELKSGAAVVASGEAREGSAVAWIESLAGARAETFSPQDGAARVDAPWRLHVEREGESEAYVVEVLDAGAAGVRVRRGAEPQVVSYPASVSQLVTPSARPFRSLRLLDEKLDALHGMELLRGDERERLTRDAEGRWSVEQPIRVAADRVTADEAARLIAGLEAARFVADGAEPAHGLDVPSVTVRARFGDAATERVHVLELGAETEGGRFGRVDRGPEVFVAAPALVDAVARPLADRNLLAVPIELLDAASVTRADATFAIRRTGETFSAATPVHPGAAHALAERIAALRARAATHYGRAGDGEGMANPTAVVRVTARASANPTPASYDIVIGSLVAAGDGYHARRSDAAVSFVLPKEQVESLWAATASPASRATAPATEPAGDSRDRPN